MDPCAKPSKVYDLLRDLGQSISPTKERKYCNGLEFH